MAKRTLSMFLAITMLLVMMVPQVVLGSGDDVSIPESYRKLLDIQILMDNLLAVGLEVVRANLKQSMIHCLLTQRRLTMVCPH